MIRFLPTFSQYRAVSNVAGVGVAGLAQQSASSFDASVSLKEVTQMDWWWWLKSPPVHAVLVSVDDDDDCSFGLTVETECGKMSWLQIHFISLHDMAVAAPIVEVSTTIGGRWLRWLMTESACNNEAALLLLQSADATKRRLVCGGGLLLLRTLARHWGLFTR